MMKRSEPASPVLNTTSPPLTALEYASLESGVGISGILSWFDGPGGPGPSRSERQREAADDRGLGHQAVARDGQQHVETEQQRPRDVDAHAEPGQDLGDV